MNEKSKKLHLQEIGQDFTNLRAEYYFDVREWEDRRKEGLSKRQGNLKHNIENQNSDFREIDNINCFVRNLTKQGVARGRFITFGRQLIMNQLAIVQSVPVNSGHLSRIGSHNGGYVG